jgi:hypothetical protein
MESMLQHVAFGGYLLAAAWAMARLEVQIEGRNGWARNLPTWRVDNRLTRALFGGRPLTGYHFFFHILVALLVHSPFALGFAPLTVPAELRILSFLILFWLIEDWLWFVVNPAFGPAAFRADRIHWHRSSWWLIMPREYWIAAPIGVGLYILSHTLA